MIFFQPDDIAQAKKTDEPSPDDEPAQSEDTAAGGDADTAAKKKSKASLDAEEETKVRFLIQLLENLLNFMIMVISKSIGKRTTQRCQTFHFIISFMILRQILHQYSFNGIPYDIL